MSILIPKPTPSQTYQTITANTAMMEAFVSYAVFKQTFESIKKHKTVSEKIATVSYDGFNVDLNKMVVGKKYLVNYDGSKYEIAKNKKGELELYEVGFDE